MVGITRWRLFGMGIGSLCLLVSAVQGQGTITLRPRTAMQTSGEVTLRMMADLSGPEAEALGDLVVVPSASFEDGLVVGVGRIRELIEKSPGVNFGRLTLSGSACKLSLHKELFEAPTASSPTIPADSSSSSGADTVRTRIMGKLAEHFGVSEEDIRIELEDRSSPILNVPIQGRIVVIDAAANGDRIPLQIRIFEGDRLLETGTVRTKPMIRREVNRTLLTIGKGDSVDETKVTRSTDWLPPSVVPASIELLSGKQACTRISEGQIVEERHVKPPQVINRGDICLVDCISGGMVVQVRARALANGRDGETISFQSLTGKRAFQARVAGQERAVMTLNRNP